MDDYNVWEVYSEPLKIDNKVIISRLFYRFAPTERAAKWWRWWYLQWDEREIFNVQYTVRAVPIEEALLDADEDKRASAQKAWVKKQRQYKNKLLLGRLWKMLRFGF